MFGRLTLVVLVSSLVPVVAPATAQRAEPAGGLTVPSVQFTLANGLTVILHEDHSVPQIAVNVWYHVGSAREQPGRTGFAHLFEHLMFEGSGHVAEGEIDRLLAAVGGAADGSTTEDRTNYYETVSSNALDLALFLESDRMGYLLDVVTPGMVDQQRDVVLNERRERYENAPYGQALLRLSELIYPEDHPYHWPVVGYADDLRAVTHDDVSAFFRQYYGPGNASLVIAGDIDPDVARARVEYWFGDVPAGEPVPPLDAPPVRLDRVITEQLTDQVQLPRVFLAWPTPGRLAPGDAELDVVAGVLSSGKNSRLYRRLVYDLELAQDVAAAQYASDLDSIFLIDVTARPSDEPADDRLARIVAIVDEELGRLRDVAPDAREVERVRNGLETAFVRGMQTVAGKADRLNAYFAATGNPDYFNEDLGRYRALDASDVQAAVRRWLPEDRRVELSVVPEGP